MKSTEVLSHIVLSIVLVACILTGLHHMDEYGVNPFFALLTLGGSFVLGLQLMFIVTGE